jgi:hypothetical protein
VVGKDGSAAHARTHKRLRNNIRVFQTILGCLALTRARRLCGARATAEKRTRLWVRSITSRRPGLQLQRAPQAHMGQKRG